MVRTCGEIRLHGREIELIERLGIVEVAVGIRVVGVLAECVEIEAFRPPVVVRFRLARGVVGTDVRGIVRGRVHLWGWGGFGLATGPQREGKGHERESLGMHDGSLPGSVDAAKARISTQSEESAALLGAAQGL